MQTKVAFILSMLFSINLFKNSTLLTCLKDEDLNVKRATLTMLNSAAHNKATLIRDLLPEVLPKLYNETKVRKELIRFVRLFMLSIYS